MDGEAAVAIHDDSGQTSPAADAAAVATSGVAQRGERVSQVEAQGPSGWVQLS